MNSDDLDIKEGDFITIIDDDEYHVAYVRKLSYYEGKLSNADVIISPCIYEWDEPRHITNLSRYYLEKAIKPTNAEIISFKESIKDAILNLSEELGALSIAVNAEIDKSRITNPRKLHDYDSYRLGKTKPGYAMTWVASRLHHIKNYFKGVL